MRKVATVQQVPNREMTALSPHELGILAGFRVARHFDLLEGSAVSAPIPAQLAGEWLSNAVFQELSFTSISQ